MKPTPLKGKKNHGQFQGQKNTDQTNMSHLVLLNMSKRRRQNSSICHWRRFLCFRGANLKCLAYELKVYCTCI